MRNIPGGRVRELDATRFLELMERFPELGRVFVRVSNGVTTMGSFGQFGNYSTNDEFFTVQTRSLEMYFWHERIDSVFAVEKPGHLDGVVALSFQFYDPHGASAFKGLLTFGKPTPTSECQQQRETFVTELALK